MLIYLVVQQECQPVLQGLAVTMQAHGNYRLFQPSVSKHLSSAKQATLLLDNKNAKATSAASVISH